MKFIKINFLIVCLSAVPVGLLTVLSLSCYWAAEGGNDSDTVNFISHFFTVFRFPTHPFLWDYMIASNGGHFAVLFIFGLLFNVAFYAIILERILWVVKRLIKKSRYIS